jgi:hypothetical protein
MIQLRYVHGLTSVMHTMRTSSLRTWEVAHQDFAHQYFAHPFFAHLYFAHQFVILRRYKPGNAFVDFDNGINQVGYGIRTVVEARVARILRQPGQGSLYRPCQAWV